MPLWSPPTPPQDDSDVYVDDACMELMYKPTVIPAHQLPPVYIPPAQKKSSYYEFKRGYVNSPKENTPPSLSPMKEDDHGFSDPLKKSPKLKRDEPIFAPRSLFDRPSPALAKLRRDFKLQKYSGRPIMGGMSKTLPTGISGVISFPMLQNQKAAPIPQSDGGDWLILEDFTLLEAVQHIMELPLNLLVVNLAQTPNWEFCAEIVNMVSKTYRTAKQCRNRYESFVGPREEGKLVQLETQAPPPKKSKKKILVKSQPQVATKPGRLLKTSQMMVQDNNSQVSGLFNSKFDLIKGIATKRNVPKPVACSPAFKVFKQTGIFQEHGIIYDNPLSATSIAQARYDRIQLERKRLIQAQQAQVVTQTVPVLSSGATSPVTQGQPTPTSPVTTSTASSPIMTSTSPATASEVVQKARISAAAVSLGGLTSQAPITSRGIMPIVISNATTSNLGDLIGRGSGGVTTGQIVTSPSGPAKRQYSVVPSSQAAKSTGGKTPPAVRQTTPQTLSVSSMSATSPHLLQYVSKNSSHIVVQQVGQQQGGGTLQPASPASQQVLAQQKKPIVASSSPIPVTTSTVVTTTTNTSSSTIPPLHLVSSAPTASKATVQKGRVGQPTGIFSRNMMPFVLQNASTMSTANLNELIARGTVGVISPANAPAVSATTSPKRFSMAQPHYQIITQNQKPGGKIGSVRVSTASGVVQQQQQQAAAAANSAAQSHIVQYMPQKNQIVVQQPIPVGKGTKPSTSFQSVVSSSQVVSIPTPMSLSVASPSQVVSTSSGTASEAVQKAKLAAGQNSNLYATRGMMPIVISQSSQNTNLSELFARGVVPPASVSSSNPPKRQYSVLARTATTTGALGQTSLTTIGGGHQMIQYTSGKNPILLQQPPIQIHQGGTGVKGQAVVLSPSLSQALGPMMEPPSTGPLASSLIGSPSVSLSQPTLIQQTQGGQVQRTIKMQLVKQHTVGGKTVTRPVSDAEVAVFLKQHGITQSRLAINQQAGGTVQAVKTTTTTPTRAGGATASQIISPANLQKLGFQVQTSGSGSSPVATIVKAPVPQGTSPGSGLVPFALSQVKTLVLQQGLNQPVSFRLHTPATSTSTGTPQPPPISLPSQTPLLTPGIPTVPPTPQPLQHQQPVTNPMMLPAMTQSPASSVQTPPRTTTSTTPSKVAGISTPQSSDAPLTTLDLLSKTEEPTKDPITSFDPGIVETPQVGAQTEPIP